MGGREGEWGKRTHSYFKQKVKLNVVWFVVNLLCGVWSIFFVVCVLRVVWCVFYVLCGVCSMCCVVCGQPVVWSTCFTGF